MPWALPGSHTAMVLTLQGGRQTYTREHATAPTPTCPALTAGMPLLFACQEF